MRRAAGIPRLPAAARRLRRDDAGGAAVEFALVLPVLLALLLAIVEFGRAWNRSHVMTDAAREGARWAVVRDGADKLVTVRAVIQDRLTAAGLDWDGEVDHAATCTDWTAPTPAANAVTVAGCGWGDATGSPARVVIFAPYPFAFIQPALRLLPGDAAIGPKMLSTNLVMRNE